MKVIGLTGGTGSGKSVVSRALEAEGAFIIDADSIAHDIIKKGRPAYNEIVEYFGEGILRADGEIFRRGLGEIVFRDGEKLAFLNRCTHKYIVEEVRAQIEKAKNENRAKCIVIDAPLLTEAGLDKDCNAVWVVYAEDEARIRRIMERDGISRETAKARIAKQKTWEEYKGCAQEIIDNSRAVEAVYEQVKRLLEGV